MNMMLVAVGERTREIVLRKALGAKRSEILLQFLSESVMICGVGGVLGVGCGVLFSKAMAHLAVRIVQIVPAVAGSYLAAVGTDIGILFGVAGYRLWVVSCDKSDAAITD